MPSKKAYYEWALLDTHDALTDECQRFIKPKFLYDIVVGRCRISLSKSGNGIEVSCKNLCSLFDLIGRQESRVGFQLVSRRLTISFFALKLTVDKLAVT